MPRTSTEIAPSITVRDETGELVETSLRDVSSEAICRAQPYRTFRWYLGQKHYSGSYWSSTESAHVIYESRLELARLLIADFDRSVTRIVAQPLLLRARIQGKVRRHIPDYWLHTSDGSVVVDVKPAKRLNDPVVQATFELKHPRFHAHLVTCDRCALRRGVERSTRPRLRRVDVGRGGASAFVRCTSSPTPT